MKGKTIYQNCYCICIRDVNTMSSSVFLKKYQKNVSYVGLPLQQLYTFTVVTMNELFLSYQPVVKVYILRWTSYLFVVIDCASD